MSTPAQRLDAAAEPEARELLESCCGSRAWVEGMLARRPFGDAAALHAAAEEVWWGLGREDWLEAFAHHPEIGDVDRLRERFGAGAAFSEGEQAGISDAGEEVLRRLAAGNRAYREKFGYVFLVCATGKTAAQMLELLEARLPADPGAELEVAAGEQAKITRLRLEKL